MELPGKVASLSRPPSLMSFHISCHMADVVCRSTPFFFQETNTLYVAVDFLFAPKYSSHSHTKSHTCICMDWLVRRLVDAEKGALASLSQWARLATYIATLASQLARQQKTQYQFHDRHSSHDYMNHT